MNKVIIFSAPSGSGKSTIVNHILRLHPEMEFSVSATSRLPRGTETNGKEYWFFTPDQFKKMIADDDFVEYEEVYPNYYYGTLRSEVEKIWNKNHIILFDVDVKGGVNLKKYFGDKALSVFIKAPSIEELKNRLINRHTDSDEDIKKRVSKAESEMLYESKFDYVLVNDDMETAFKDAENVVNEFIKK